MNTGLDSANLSVDTMTNDVRQNDKDSDKNSITSEEDVMNSLMDDVDSSIDYLLGESHNRQHQNSVHGFFIQSDHVANANQRSNSTNTGAQHGDETGIISREHTQSINSAQSIANLRVL